MSIGLGNLKDLALSFNDELEEHNVIIDRLQDKADNGVWTVKKQNQDMDKLINPRKK